MASKMRTISPELFKRIEYHLMCGINLIAQAEVILPVNLDAGCKMLRNAEEELMRALNMYGALPDVPITPFEHTTHSTS